MMAAPPPPPRPPDRPGPFRGAAVNVPDDSDDDSDDDEDSDDRRRSLDLRRCPVNKGGCGKVAYLRKQRCVNRHCRLDLDCIQRNIIDLVH